MSPSLRNARFIRGIEVTITGGAFSDYGWFPSRKSSADRPLFGATAAVAPKRADQVTLGGDNWPGRAIVAR